MSARKKSKVSTEGGDSFGANAFTGAFAGLSTTGLPAGELKPRAAAAPSAKKAGKKKSNGRVEVRREKAGRGGKTVTTLKEFPSHIPLKTLEAMTFDLKKTCACGGTLKGRVIELQGDVRDRVCTELKARHYQAVQAGG
jgi:translation initiation factor 1